MSQNTPDKTDEEKLLKLPEKKEDKDRLYRSINSRADSFASALSANEVLIT